MGQRKSINLFDTKASLTPFWQLVEKSLIFLKRFLLLAVFVTGLVLVTSYVVINMRKTQLDIEQKQLSQAIQNQSVKEGLLLALRARIASLKRILDAQISLSPYIDTTLLIARPPTLGSFSIGSKNTVTISIVLPNIQDAVAMMENIVMLVNLNKIKNPILTSFTMDKDGIVKLGIAYSVILGPAL